MKIAVLMVEIPMVVEWIMLAFFSLWLATIIEVSISRFRSRNDKWIWLLVVVLAGLIGCIFYFFMGRKNRIQEEDVEREEQS